VAHDASILPVADDNTIDDNKKSNNDSGGDNNQKQPPPPPTHPSWLPPSWNHQLIPRTYNRYSKSKTTTTHDRYYYSPKCGFRFRSKPEVDKFLYHLEQVITTRKMKKKRREEYEGKDEMDAYDLFRGSSCSFTNGKWKKKKRDRTSICGNSGSGVASSCNYDDDGTDDSRIIGRKKKMITRKSPRVQIKQTTCSAAAAAVVPEVGTSTGLKPDSIVSSRPHRGGTGAAETRGQNTKQQQEEVPIGNIGYTFRKQFHDGWYTGSVVKIRPGAALNKDRRCVYEDGDEEDLSLEELKILVTLDSSRRLNHQHHRKDDTKTTLLVGGDTRNDISASSNNLPKPANGYEYTKMEAMQIITSFPKKYQCVPPTDPDYSDGRQRGKAIQAMFTKGWVPITKKNLYKNVKRYEAGKSISTEWKVNTTTTLLRKDGDLVCSSIDPKELSRNLPGKLDEYLESERNKKWYGMFEKLKAFKNEHGTTNIYKPTRGVDEYLKKWAKTMRFECRAFVSGHTTQNRRRIDEMRFALLQSIGFDLELVGPSPSQSRHTKSVARKRGFVPDKALHKGHAPPPPAPSRKRVRVSVAAKEPNPEDQEVILLDSLNEVPLDKTAESTFFQTNAGGDEADSSDGSEDEHGEDKEWLHKVASLLTTEKSTTRKGQRRPPSGHPSRSILSVASTSPPSPTMVAATVPDAVTSSQFKAGAIPATQLKTNCQTSSANGSIMGKSSIGDVKKKWNLVDKIFYWFCSNCDSVNKFRSTECSSCKECKNSHSKRSLLLEKAENAIESDEVQLVKEASKFIPAVDRQAIPDKVIAYLLQQKIPGVIFSAFCRSPSNELDDYFYWICGSCKMKNSYARTNCTACLQPKSALADDSSLLAIAKEAAVKSKTVEEAIALIPPKERRAIPVAILDGLVTCNSIIGDGWNQRRCRAVRCAGFDYCLSHWPLIQHSHTTPQGSQEDDFSTGCSPIKSDQYAVGISKINEYFPTFLAGIDDKAVNNLNWSVNCIEDSILCGENKPFPLGLKVRKFFFGHGFHDGIIVKTVRKLLVDNEAKDDRPVLVYRIVYNDDDEEDFLHHEIASLRQVFDQAVSPEASPSVQIPAGTCFELKTGNTVRVVCHKNSQVCRNQQEGDRLVVQCDNSSKETEVDLFKFQLAVVRKIRSSNSCLSLGDDCHRPLLEWGAVDGSSQPNDYDIGEGLTLSRQRYKASIKDNIVSSFTSSTIDNPLDVRPGVKVRMWDPAQCFNHLSYDPYAATVVSSFHRFLFLCLQLPFSYLHCF
jgi:hypothetical protein